MANVSAIKLPNGNTYDIKDTISGYTTNTGTITKVQTTAGAHSTINVSSGAATFNVPTKTSHLTNDSGFITASHTSTYSLPLAASGTRGGVQIGYSESGTNYAVKLSSEKMYVTVPWTDTQVTNTAVTAASTYYLVGSSSSSTATGGLNKHGAVAAYVTANSGTGGSARIDLGNTTATTSAGGKQGILRLYGTAATYYTDLIGSATSSNKTITLPNKTGTVALTSDIPTISYPVTSVNTKTGAVNLTASDVGALSTSGGTVTGTTDFVDGTNGWAMGISAWGPYISNNPAEKSYLYINSTNNLMQLMNVAEPTVSTDAATKGYVDNKAYTLSMATSSGTSQITLAASTKYQLTAGGSTYIFTTPPNTTYSAMTTTEIDNAIAAAT